MKYTYFRHQKKKVSTAFGYVISLEFRRISKLEINNWESPVYTWCFPGGTVVKNPPAILETWVQFLGWEDSLEEGVATHSSILAWRIPVDRGAWWAIVYKVTKSWT